MDGCAGTFEKVSKTHLHPNTYPYPLFKMEVCSSGRRSSALLKRLLLVGISSRRERDLSLEKRISGETRLTAVTPTDGQNPLWPGNIINGRIFFFAAPSQTPVPPLKRDVYLLDEDQMCPWGWTPAFLKRGFVLWTKIKCSAGKTTFGRYVVGEERVLSETGDFRS
ncbi:hypothetical protein CEXT_151441 [Caerostris extrusa]|uniref:Uncharacterized protein n=1 Tax=Caerostris extrusa TaxID=172846 RepID=A0AAV4SY50_CAEEX|nr:hypothetical protein CEXT_151441 [Caerostris extrusa]